MYKKLPGAFLPLTVITNLALAQDPVEYRDCLEGRDAEILSIATVDWPVSWKITLDPGASCSYVTYSSSYIRWESDAAISVKYQLYDAPTETEEGEDMECPAPAEDAVIDWEPYLQRSPMYTVQTEWPYTNKDACATEYVLTNDSAELFMTAMIFTEGSLNGLRVALASALAAFLVF